MQKTKSIFIGIFLILSFINFGCANNPKPKRPQSSEKISIASEKKNKIKKIAIVTAMNNNELVILDHTEVENKDYLLEGFGAAGLALESVLLEKEKRDKINSSLGGGQYSLVKDLGNYPVKAVLDSKLISRFSKVYRVVSPDDFDTQLKKRIGEAEPDIDDYMMVCNDVGAGTLLKVDFDHGLAVYTEEKASVSIDAQIHVYDVETKELLVKKYVSSDTYFRSGHTIHQFTSYHARRIKMDFIDAADGLSLRIASEFGIDLDQAIKQKKDIDEILKISTVSCNHPYLLARDCTELFGSARAQRIIEVRGSEAKIAGSNDGKTILVMAGNKTRVLFKDAFTLNFNEYTSAATNDCFIAVRDELLSKGFKFLKIVKLRSHASTLGFVMEVDRDGYSALKVYTK